MWKQRLKRCLQSTRSQNGSALIEFMLVIPVYYFLIVGFFAIALVFVNYLSITYALKEAVRYASTHSLKSANPITRADLVNYIQNAAYYPVLGPPTDSDVVFLCANGSNLTSAEPCQDSGYQYFFPGNLIGIAIVYKNVDFLGLDFNGTQNQMYVEGYRVVTQ